MCLNRSLCSFHCRRPGSFRAPDRIHTHSSSAREDKDWPADGPTESRFRGGGCVCVSNLCVVARKHRRATGLSKLQGPPRVLEKRPGGVGSDFRSVNAVHSPDVQGMKQCQRMIVFSGGLLLPVHCSTHKFLLQTCCPVFTKPRDSTSYKMAAHGLKLNCNCNCKP